MIWAMMLTGLMAQDDPSAAARAEAEAIIAAAGVEGVFENVTADSVPAVRHVSSGLICRFTPGEETNRIVVHPAMDLLAEGDNVGCDTRAQAMHVSVHAARYAAVFPAEHVLNDAVAAIRNRWPDAMAHEGGFPLLTAPTRDEPPLHAVFTAENDRGPFVTFVLVQHQGEWSYRFRGTRDGDDVIRAGMTGGLMFMNALADVDRPACDDVSCLAHENHSQ